MSVDAYRLCSDRPPGVSTGTTQATGRAMRVADAGFVPESTATVPSQLPRPSADCFDRAYPEATLMYSGPVPVFLTFDEFEGLAPNVPLLVMMEYRRGLYELEHPDLGLYGRGTTSQEAFVDFLEYLVADYRAYAEEADENLDTHARALANRYRKLLRRV